MKGYWMYIKLMLAIIATGVLFGFSQKRNNSRKLTEVSIEFTDDNDPFLTLSAVNKLLIQNNDSITSIAKETLVLKEMEYRLMQNPMVRKAQVFVTIDGKLGASIEQRKPIGRVTGGVQFYIDEDGKRMPLSPIYSARVPLVTGHSSKEFTELTPLLRELRADPFMNQIVTGIHQRNDGKLLFALRKQDFKVMFGKPDNIQKKFQNFKAFYQKAQKDTLLSAYRLVDLQFGSQVVATKK